MAIDPKERFAYLSDDGLAHTIRIQSDFVIQKSEQLERKKKDVVEAEDNLARESEYFDMLVAEQERRRKA